MSSLAILPELLTAAMVFGHSLLMTAERAIHHDSLLVMFAADEWKARVDLAAIYRLCHSLGFNEGINNHLTAAVPDMPGHFLVFPFGLLWSEVTASNLLLVDSEVSLQFCILPMYAKVRKLKPLAPWNRSYVQLLLLSNKRPVALLTKNWAGVLSACSTHS